MISSVENEKVKNLVKLKKKKYRDITETYIVEGYHLVEEAYKAGVVDEIFLLKIEVSLDVMSRISSMDTPCEIVALCHKKQFQDIKENDTLIHKVLLLDEIQDPGNLGTIIRSSVAFGIDMIILSENTVDLYNPKVLRATQGMYCHIPILSLNAVETLNAFKKKHYQIFGTNVENGVDVRELKEEDKRKFCLVVGNEGKGVRPEIQEMCDANLYIAMKEDVESLNVGVACSILLYELGR